MKFDKIITKEKYDKTVLSHQTIINKIKKQVQTIINVHYKKRKIENTLDKLQQLFGINNVIANIENNERNILI